MTQPTIICQNCKKESREDARFCSGCGQPLLAQTTPATDTPRPVEIFLSYSHEDAKLLEQLIKHLKILQRTGLGMVWYDQDISIGSEWEKGLFGHLDTANIILLLISSDFIASDFCYSKEMERAMERHARDEARVIPVILRPTSWHDTPFAKLQGLPKNGKAITLADNRDSAFLEVVQGIQGVLKEHFGLTPKK